jgi:hypothetical protein
MAKFKPPLDALDRRRREVLARWPDLSWDAAVCAVVKESGYRKRRQVICDALLDYGPFLRHMPPKAPKP